MAIVKKKKSKGSEGTRFQNNIRESCKKDNILYYKFKDSPSIYGGKQDNIRFTPNNICDILMYDNYLVFAELKSTKSNSFSFTDNAFRQLMELNDIVMDNSNNFRKGVSSGFIIEFRELEKTIFIFAYEIIRFLNTNNVKTVNMKKVLDNSYKLDYIELEGVKKKVNTTYNITKLIKDIKGGNIYEKDIFSDGTVI